MHTDTTNRSSEVIYSLFGWPKLLLMGSLAIVIVAVIGLQGVEKDPSVDAFVPGDHPAALARDIARDVFGLEDPVVVGLAAPDKGSAFTPARLEALVRIDRGIRAVEGVKKNGVVSLASENVIMGTGGDLKVEPIIPILPLALESASLAWHRFQAMPMLSGLLASDSGDMLLIIVPVENPNNATIAVEAIRALALAEAGGELQVHLAGVATMNARLSGMVEGDTRIFVPLAVLMVLVILYVALRRTTALLGPLFVIAGAAGVAIGTMGWIGSKYYLITTALPVVIMAIAVADSLHLCTYYLRARANDAAISAQDAAWQALRYAWLPVSLTSLTTVAAFIGLSFGTAMQPISEFGYYAATGVVAALIFSLTALPAILILTDLKPAAGSESIARDGCVDHVVSAVTAWSFHRPAFALCLVLAFSGLLVVFGSQAQFDYERKRYFMETDTVRIDDGVINERMGGINFLDVVVRSPEPGGLMSPAAMESIRALRAEIAALPLVVNVSGIDEYISLMHRVLTDADPGTLPSRERAPGQYMFLYEASGAPEDFKREIDYEHTRALIRAQLSTDSYQETRPVVEALSLIIDAWSVESGLEGQISGRVAVNDGWMSQLADNHFRGLGMALTLVFLTTLAMFRSFIFSLLALVPVLLGVVMVYATMGVFAIGIAPATSMTAAIATGLGIDFGVHLISLLRRRHCQGALGLQAFTGQYTVVARACFYSAVALGFALSVVCFSSAPPLRWFGLLVAVGAFGSLFGALLVVPAIWAASTKLSARRSADAVSLSN